MRSKRVFGICDEKRVHAICVTIALGAATTYKEIMLSHAKRLIMSINEKYNTKKRKLCNENLHTYFYYTQEYSLRKDRREHFSKPLERIPTCLIPIVHWLQTNGQS